ncbi:MAG: hypothetical protein QXX20_07035 [Candidatus Thermoplasmatota archaeon]
MVFIRISLNLGIYNDLIAFLPNLFFPHTILKEQTAARIITYGKNITNRRTAQQVTKN